MYKNIKSLCCPLETNTILHVMYNFLLKKKDRKMLDKMISMGPASSDILIFYSLKACGLTDALEDGKIRKLVLEAGREEVKPLPPFTPIYKEEINSSTKIARKI